MTYLLALLGGLVGAAIGWVAVAAAALAISGYYGVSDFEGARAMTAVFFYGPMGGVVGLVAGVWLVLRARGVTGFKALAWRFPLVLAAIAGLAAVVFAVLYQLSPILNAGGAAPQLVFEIRLPPGSAPPGEGVAVTLFTEKNTMPGTIDTAAARQDGDRPVLAGTVELAYRSSWRLLELKRPEMPEYLFGLKLNARPGPDPDFLDWEHVTNVGNGTNTPRQATADDAYDIRYRVVWPE